MGVWHLQQKDSHLLSLQLITRSNLVMSHVQALCPDSLVCQGPAKQGFPSLPRYVIAYLFRNIKFFHLTRIVLAVLQQPLITPVVHTVFTSFVILKINNWFFGGPGFVKIMAFLKVTPCKAMDNHRRFGWITCLHLQNGRQRVPLKLI
jgi:hypothetical protein